MAFTAIEVRNLLSKRSNPEEMLDLTGAMMRNTTWIGVEFRNVDFHDAIFVEARMHHCVFIKCRFVCADFEDADLCWTHFYDCLFEDTDMSSADLRDAQFHKCDTDGIIANARTAGFWPVCPVEGAFIGWKWASDCLVKLRIPEDAQRSSGTSRKCRCDKAEVLEITRDGEPVEETYSDHDFNFMYRVGEIVEEPRYNPDRWKICTSGIHFFMTKDEAENYGRY